MRVICLSESASFQTFFDSDPIIPGSSWSVTSRPFPHRAEDQIADRPTNWKVCSISVDAVLENRIIRFPETITLSMEAIGRGRPQRLVHKQIGETACGGPRIFQVRPTLESGHQILISGESQASIGSPLLLVRVHISAVVA